MNVLELGGSLFCLCKVDFGHSGGYCIKNVCVDSLKLTSQIKSNDILHSSNTYEGRK